MITIDLEVFQTFGAALKGSSDVIELYTLLQQDESRPGDRAVATVLTEQSLSQVVQTVGALGRWADVRGFGQTDITLADLRARVSALGEVDDAESQADAEVLDRLLTRVLALTAPEGALEAVRAAIRAGSKG